MLMVLAALLLTCGAWAQQANYVGTSTGDCWMGPGYQNVTGNTVEMKNNGDAGMFYGVMAFQFDAPQSGYEVATATLRLTTRYKKGDSELAIYALNADVTDASKYDDLSSAIASAMATTPIKTFRVNGDGAWAPTDGGIGDDYLTASAWQNTIDLTSYVKSLSGNKFAIVMQKTYVQDNSTQIYSKEATDVTNTTKNVTFAAADLIPQLTVTYQEATGLTEVKVGSSNDLWVRTDNESASSTGNEIEMKNNGATKFYGLIDFDFTKPTEGQSVKSASLRLVTRFKKGDSQVKMYGYSGTVDESSTNYGNAQTAISAALETDPVADFRLNSSAQWAPTDGGVGDDYLTVDKWTNTLDVTAYIKTLANTGHVAFLLEKVYNQDNSSQIFSKEATDQTNSTKGFTFKKEDLVPQLTIIYQDKENLAIKDEEKSTDDKDVYTVNGVEEALTVTITKTIDAEGETAAAHGSLEVKAMENAESKIIVTLTPKPDAGHAIDGTPVVEVVSGDSNGDTPNLSRALEIGSKVDVTANEDGTYSFEMPDNPVEVTAKFKAVVIVVTKPVLTYDEAGNKVSVAFGTVGDEETAATKIYYTTDGTDPKSSETRTELTAGTDIEVTDGMSIIKAVGCDANGNFSDVVEQEVARLSSLKVTKEWVAFYSPNTYTLPEGLKAYTIEGITQPADGQTGTVTLKEQTVINKNTPMLIENTVLDTKTTFVITAADDVTIPAAQMCSEFKGVAEATQLDATNGSVYYVLKDGVFLRVANPGTVSAYNCYIEIPAESAASAARSLSIGGDGTTGIANVKQIVDEGDEAWYTLTGVRMAKPTQKGVYIHNGKKIIIK